MKVDLRAVASRIASGGVSPRIAFVRETGLGPFIAIAAAVRIAGVENVSYIKKTKGKGYCVKSEHNPDWSGGCYPTKAEANKRLEQVEAAKHAKASEPATSGITYKSAPEYKTLESFVEYLIDDDRDDFTAEDLAALNYRLRKPIHEIRKDLEGYGLKFQPKQPEKKTRGITDKSTRWHGPGAEPTHGGSGFSNLE